jgi:hypothetical protein
MICAMFQRDVVGRIKPHISYLVFFPENLAVCEIMWKNMFGEADRPQVTM